MPETAAADTAEPPAPPEPYARGVAAVAWRAGWRAGHDAGHAAGVIDVAAAARRRYRAGEGQ
jgi:hypothetical protein